MEKVVKVRMDTCLLLACMAKLISFDVDIMDEDELMRLSFMAFTKD